MASDPVNLTKKQLEIDNIDRQLFQLARHARFLELGELAKAITVARLVSLQLLPEERQRQVE